MFGRLIAGIYLFVGFGCLAVAQQQPTLCDPNASVGVPYTCDLGQETGFSEIAAQIPADSGVTFTFGFTVDSASSLPPGLTITPDGLISGTPTATGAFETKLDLALNLSATGTVILNETIPLPFTLQVGGSTEETTAVDPGALTFAFNLGDTTTSSQSITLSNRTNQALTFTASASSDRNWLTVSPASGTAGPFSMTSLVATANPSGLQPGIYLGNISISSSSFPAKSVPVILTVSGSQQGISLSQTGLHFQAVQGGATPPQQNIAVLNQGKNTVSFSTAISTLAGGSWLSVSPASGSVASSSSATVGVKVTPTGLAPGNYYGTVTVTAQGEESSPQTLSVVLNVFAPQNSPGPSLSTTALIFVAQAGGQNPAAQSVIVGNPSPNPLTFATTPFADSATAFFMVQPSSGTIAAGSQPIMVQPAITGLSKGIYTGEIVVTFSDPSTQPPLVFVRRIEVVLIVIPSSGSSAGLTNAAPASSCTPTKLIPVFTQLGAGFQVSAGWPTPLEVTVVDDCGTRMAKGSVVAGFSSGDPAIPLTSLNDGRWTGTWNPHGASAIQVTITVDAQEAQPVLHGSSQIGGGLAPNPTVPVVSSGGVVSAASNAAHQPIGPGSYISIYGSGFNDSTHVSKKLPLPNSLAGTQALIAGKPVPLYFTSTGQINAIVPFNVPVNTTQQLLVSVNGAISVPEPVVLATAQPAIFTRDQTGKGLGVIVGFKAHTSTSFLIDAQHPVSIGDTLVIYCTGLGPVDQSVTAGSASPSSPPAKTVNPVTVTVGGKNASVKFAGLAPGLAVYQVNVVVPSGVASGKSVPVVVSTAGLQSDPVTIVVK